MKIHGAPYGVTDYVDTYGAAPGPGQVAWPWLTAQTHWKATGPTPNPPGPLVPGIAHTHIEGWFPIWAELPAGPVTVPIVLRLFQTSGSITGIQAEIMGVLGGAPMSDVVIDTPLPLVGNPTGLVSVTGHIVFDPSKAFPLDDAGKPTTTLTIPVHGWFNCMIAVQTNYTDGRRVDNFLWWPSFSMVDSSAPEPVYGEGTMQLAAKSTIQPDDVMGGVGIQLVEIRGTEDIQRGYVPFLAPFNTPQVFYPLGYNYESLPDLFPQYELRLDANFHMGVEGTLIETTKTAAVDGVSVRAPLDPVVIAASQVQMGTTPGHHRLAVMWQQETGAGSPGFAPNQRIVSLLGFEVAIGDNPTGLPAPSISVPNVVGLTQSAANSDLTAAGLMLGMVSSASSLAVPVGVVISQVPAAGALAVEMASVAVVVSSGPPVSIQTVIVPNVVGKDQVTAGTTLLALGLARVAVSANDATMPVGDVISQSPAAGTIVALASVVTLTVSLGPVAPPPPPLVQGWVDAVPSFMQFYVDGVPQPGRWAICDPKLEMTGANCPEIATKPVS